MTILFALLVLVGTMLDATITTLYDIILCYLVMFYLIMYITTLCFIGYLWYNDSCYNYNFM